MTNAWLDAFERWSGTREQSSASDAFKAGWDAFADPGIPAISGTVTDPDMGTHLVVVRVNRLAGNAVIALDARNPVAVDHLLQFVGRVNADSITIFARREEFDDGAQGNWLEEGLRRLEVARGSSSAQRD